MRLNGGRYLPIEGWSVSMTRLIGFALLYSVLGGTGAQAQEFSEGQVWAYETRPHEQDSVLTIGKIDQASGNSIVHISISGLQIEIADPNGGMVNLVGHMPFAESALKASVTSLVGTTDVPPEFQTGYEEWRRAYENENADYFTISVSEGIETMEQILNQK